MNPTAKGGSFFRTMVLMGSSVAMSCGGMTHADGTGGSSSSGAGPNGTGGTDTTGGGTGTGGSGSGGLPGGSGGAIIDPGTGGEGYYNFGGAFPTDCPTAQLDCGATNDCSSYDHQALALPGDCVCDSDLPDGPEDCADNEGFTCLMASQDAYGRQIDPPVAYNCECITEQAGWNGDCFGFCSEHTKSIGSAHCNAPGEITEDLQAYLCGCAVTVLK